MASSVRRSAMASGFSDPVTQAQRVFRRVLDALARPGTIHDLAVALSPPEPLFMTTAGVLLALADFETPIWFDDNATREAAAGDFVRLHTGARLAATTMEAVIGVITDVRQLPDFMQFAQGTVHYPDRSATLLIQVAALKLDGYWLQGPGVDSRISFGLDPGIPDLRGRLRANREQFPCGLDLIFLSPTQIAALPRSVRLIDGT